MVEIDEREEGGGGVISQEEIKRTVEECLHDVLNEDGCNKSTRSSGKFKVTATMKNGRIDISVTGFE